MKSFRNQIVASDFIAPALAGVSSKGSQMSVLAIAASPKQVSFIQALAAERDVAMPDVAALSKSDASALIEQLIAMPKAGAVVAVGMYQTQDGAIYRVQASRESGNLYAKRLNLAGGFDYEMGAIRNLKSTDKMTLEVAKTFGMETGLCCVCGAFLTDPKSVAQGIGPVCSSRF